MSARTSKSDAYRVLRPAGHDDKYWLIHKRRTDTARLPEISVPRSTRGHDSGTWQL